MEIVTAALKAVALACILMAFIGQLQSYRSPMPELVPVVTLSSHSSPRVEWVLETPRTPNQITTVVMQTFGAVAILGVIALVSQFMWLKLHHVSTILFFGIVAFLMVINIVSELWSSGLQPSLDTDYPFMVLLLAVGVAGVVVEARQKL
jgi:hypothetical protein